VTQLTADTVREVLDYNPETGIFIWKVRDRRWFKRDRSWKQWNDKYAGTVAGSLNKNGYRAITLDYKAYYAHRLAWLYIYGVWPENEIDHINHIKDDNRINNLREATRSQNEMNGSRLKWGVSQYRGVSWSIEKNKWRSYIKVNGTFHHLGYFTVEEDAARAYDRAAIKHFGEYADLNFPEEYQQIIETY
jgi:hypothetical protein